MKARALPLLVAAATMVVPFGNAFAAAAVNAASPTAPASHGNPRSGATPGAAEKDPRLSEMFKGTEGGTEPSFRRHVVPLMSRLGCSGRECHGSFQGRGGFQLSLFGYDFDNDHGQMTTADNGDEGEVRVNLKSPAESLLLRKGAALMSHKGKERFAKGSWEYNLLLRWIGGGARIDVAETGEFDRLEVLPKEIVFRQPGDAAQLRVLAHWKDGTVEDVTEITRFRSNDESVAAVSETGRVTSSGKGDSHVVAFYDNGVVPVAVMLPASAPASYPKVVAAKNKVDELVNAKLRKAGIIPSPLCSDADFLRRASLDVTGTLPTPREVEAFLADKTADKRDRKIDELLERPGYAAWWTTKLCDFTGNNPAVLRGNNLAANLGQVNFGPQLSRQWFDWVYARISQNKPYDELAAGIVLGLDAGPAGPTLRRVRGRDEQLFPQGTAPTSETARRCPGSGRVRTCRRRKTRRLPLRTPSLGCASNAPSATSIPLTSGPSRTSPSFRLSSPDRFQTRRRESRQVQARARSNGGRQRRGEDKGNADGGTQGQTRLR
jgi:hypothetical protein